MKSIHLRRLDSRVAQTTARLINHATRQRLTVADLAGVQLPWYAIRNQADENDGGDSEDVATLLIFSEIGGTLGVSAKQLAEELEAITARTINVRINSRGGSVFDAIAIYNSLNHHPARIVVYVDALAASAASVIAMAGDEIVMMPGSQMMIHDASALEDGNAADMAAMSTFLDRQSANIAEIYQRRGGGDAAKWRDMMLAETWMFAREAVAAGLADRVEEVADEPDPDPELADLMTRAHDLSGFRYAGREAAPMPYTRRARVTTQARSPGPARDQPMPAIVPAPSTADYRAAALQRSRSLNGRQVLPGIGAARSVPFTSQLRARLTERDGREVYHIHGTATVYEQLYDMWDEFGPYQEGVRRAAGAASLAAGPDVAFLVNHKGITMARTTNDTLLLAEIDLGLDYDAWVNPKRQDVRDLVVAIEDGNVTESSFAFMLELGRWNEDFTEFWIEQYDINRGDVSAVNYGANPYTSVAARSREILRDLDHLPAGAVRAALAQLQRRIGPAELDVIERRGELVTVAATSNDRDNQPQGRTISHIEALLLDD